MARTAADLSLLLDVMAGPDPLDAGVAYKLDLPVARHQSLRDFRVLVIESHPLLPTDRDVRGAIDKLATDLTKAGVTVARESTLLPDFAETSRLYMRMLLSFLGAFFRPTSWRMRKPERVNCRRKTGASARSDCAALLQATGPGCSTPAPAPSCARNGARCSRPSTR
jgi:Asp-tRNA(Asn)/Glu-tRNA(Gln) amidotransferase A subunit family amidase